MSDVTPSAAQPTRDGPIRVFLNDDRRSSAARADLLEAEAGISVVGEAGTAAEALARIPALVPARGGAGRTTSHGDGLGVCRDVRWALRMSPA